MANPTTNYGWPMPTSTDLVTDLPADFAAFGQPVDTSLKALNPETTLGDIAYRSATANTNTRLGIGTTGQVLTVASGVPSWATPTAGMTNPMTTTGDTIYSSSGSTPARLGIGSTGQVLTVSGGIPSWSTPAAGGKVLQVVFASTTTQASNSTDTYADTGLTATITPTSASSKILVIVNQGGVQKTNGSADNAVGIKLMRGATNLATFAQYETNTSTAIFLYGSTGTNYLDSPATTSATTYKTQFRNSNLSAAAVRVQADSTFSGITLLEIGA
jgi:hypothetical protein